MAALLRPAAILEAQLGGARPVVVLAAAARPASLLRHRRLLPRRLRVRGLQGHRAPRRDRRPRLRRAARPRRRLPPLRRAQLAPQVLDHQEDEAKGGEPIHMVVARRVVLVGGAVGRGGGGGHTAAHDDVPGVRSLHVVQAALGLRLLRPLIKLYELNPPQIQYSSSSLVINYLPLLPLSCMRVYVC